MRFRTLWLHFGWMVLVFVACGGKQLSEESTAPCSVDADCSADEICKPLARTQSRPQVAGPCLATRCTADADCGTGRVCGPNFGYGPVCGPSVCVASCPTTACRDFETCEEDGHCLAQRCDEPGAVACPERFRCDPALAASEATSMQGSTLSDPANAVAAIAHGCVRERCDQTNGFACKELWECAPDRATDPSGCVALSCAETGECSGAGYICEPTSTNRRPAGEDPHGCVPRNCEEGSSCSIDLVPYTGADPIPVGYCDFDGWRSDERGCAQKNCEDGVVECDANETCEPDGPSADLLGCRALDCREGYSCPDGTLCDPGSAGADQHGCRSEGSGGGAGAGAGGASGAAGFAGVGAGGGADRAGAGGSGGRGSGGSGNASGSGGTSGETGTGGTSAGTAPDPDTGYCAPRE